MLKQTFSQNMYTAATHIMGKRATDFVFKYWAEIILGILITSYIAYFSLYTILRYHTLWSHYFDLGIMNQTVYNTYMAIRTGDYSRFLELTNPHGFDQIKRMAVHNDMFLALLAPFYFLFAGPETLLVIQTIASALGALVLFAIGKIVFSKMSNAKLMSLFFAFAYLMYPPLQRANQFDFHVVVLATPLLLIMFYQYLKKNYWMSTLCAVAALLTKEQVGLTIAFFGLFIFMQNIIAKNKAQRKKDLFFAFTLLMIGLGWFVFSMVYIIPTFRHGVHFALGYFGDFGDSPASVFFGLIKNPLLVFQYVFRKDTYEYLYSTLGPLAFLSFFSPLHLFIAAPEFAINLLSKSGAMRNIYYHYTAVITPFIFISAVYGAKFLLQLSHKIQKYAWLFVAILIVCTFYFSATMSPLPYSSSREIHPFFSPEPERFDAYIWQEKLADESIKVMATGHLAPLFSSRRYFYYYSQRYDLADYIVLSVDEAYNSYGSTNGEEIYLQIQTDKRFVSIYDSGSFEVYKKL